MGMILFMIQICNRIFTKILIKSEFNISSCFLNQYIVILQYNDYNDITSGEVISKRGDYLLFMNNNFEDYNDVAEMLKALAHPVRICLVKGIMEQGRCNVSYMQECLDLPQSTVSQHLQKLRSAGIVKTERNGLEMNYSVTNDKVKQLIQIFFEGAKQ